MNHKKTIWIVEDDPSAIFVYEDILSVFYKLKIFKELDPFVTELKSSDFRPDLLISDLKLGDSNFLDFLIIEDSIHFLTMPFIVVSNIDDIDILRICFEEGAIDYLTKPFKKNELLIKIERLIKITPTSKQLSDNDINNEVILDPYSLTLKKHPNFIVNLTSKEFHIFSLLKQVNNKNGYICRAELIREVWGPTQVSAKTLDVHLFHLRKKLHSLDIQINYKDAKGYQLKMPEIRNHG